MDRMHAAEKFTQAACETRCGTECTGECRVRAFVTVEAHGTDFYFGSHEDIVASVMTCGAACDVMENILHVRAFAMGRSAPDQLIIAASLLACTKWALLLPVLLAVLVSSVTARSGKAGSYAAR